MTSRLAALFVWASLVALPAGATDGLPVSFVSSVCEADSLVVGRVVAVRSEWTGRWVETEAIVETAEGPAAVRTIGGEVDGIGTWVSGAARFERGTRVAVLARRTTRGLVPVRGERSVLRVDEAGGPSEGDVLASVEWIWRQP